ncbi:MAG: hypothetical protein ACM3SY_12885 [Candidatus Omnitrophota bacterium]
MVDHDQEIVALSETFDALKKLDKPKIRRILNWIRDRLDIMEGKTFGEISPELSLSESPEAPLPKNKNNKKLTRNKKMKPEPAPKTRGKSGKKTIADYDSVNDLFKDANLKRVSDKILLMAAYLQEQQNYKELSSFDINLRLKRLGVGVPNISSSINGIMNKKVKLLEEITKKEGNAKAMRRKYRVTEEGLKVANNYLKNV